MRPIGPMTILVAAVAALSALFISHVATSTPPSEEAQVLTSYGVTLAVVLWVIADARTRRKTPCYDFGFLVAIFFPASLLWYVFWSRGWRGLLTLSTLVGLMLVPWLSASIAWFITHGGV
jgi:hypothetical protein